MTAPVCDLAVRNINKNTTETSGKAAKKVGKALKNISKVDMRFLVAEVIA